MHGIDRMCSKFKHHYCCMNNAFPYQYLHLQPLCNTKNTIYFPSQISINVTQFFGPNCLGTANEFSESSDILVSSPSHNPSNKRCTFRKCRFRWCRHLKQFPHTLQGNLRALICDALSAWTLSLWRLRWCFHLKTLPHSVHMNGCSSECVR